MKTIAREANGTAIEIEVTNWRFISNSWQLRYICLPDSCENLKHLKIEAANLTILSPFAFRTLVNLERLHLDLPRLLNLPGTIFSALVVLFDMSLKCDQLNELEPNTFSRNVNIRKLYILTDIRTYDAKMFVNFLNLEELTIEHAIGATISIPKADSILFYRLYTLKRLKARMPIWWDMSELMRIEHLNLAFGSAIDLEFMSHFRYLIRLNLCYCRADLMHFRLDRCPNLKVLILSHNQMVALDRKFLLNLPNLIYLDLGDCLLRNMSEVMLGKLCPHLTFFSVRENILCDPKLHIDLFTSSFRLLKLDLSSNCLQSWNFHGLFSNLVNLKILLLNNNQLGWMPAGCFWSLQNLQLLDLSENFLFKFKASWFDRTRHYNLRVLNLSSNLIRRLRKKSLKPFVCLQHLNLESNSIWRLSNRNFRYGRQLKVLNLARNQLTRLKQVQFEYLWSLMVLNLRHNEFEMIEPKTFSLLSNLKILSMKFLDSSTGLEPQLVFHTGLNLRSVSDLFD